MEEWMSQELVARTTKTALTKPIELPKEGKGTRRYVEDMLKSRFGIDLSEVPDHWIPLGVTGTLDWILICGWWCFEYTGVYDCEEQYDWIFNWNGVYEIDPDQLIMFREDQERNAFSERIGNPGIAGKERTEAVQFLVQDVYESFQTEPPPQEFVEILLYCTFMWVLDEYGRDWLADKDPIFNCVYDFGVAYLMRWDNELLDPRLVKCTEREPNTCLYCKSKTWCVLGYYIDSRWEYVCNRCAIELLEDGAEMDKRDHRLREPHCPHLGGSCSSTRCPHSGFTREGIQEAMQEAGTQRVEEYRERARVMGGNPRQLSGQSARDIVEHYADIVCPSCRTPIMSIERLVDKVGREKMKEGVVLEFDCPCCQHGIILET
jgi:hypothetical protein